jgi:hypothetical protein
MNRSEGSNPSRFHWLQFGSWRVHAKVPNKLRIIGEVGEPIPMPPRFEAIERLLRSWVTRACPPWLILLTLLPPALGAQLLVAHSAAEGLTGAQLCPTAGTS